MTKEGGKWGTEWKRRDYLRRKEGSYEEARKAKMERILEGGKEWVSETVAESSVTPSEKKTGI